MGSYALVHISSQKLLKEFWLHLLVEGSTVEVVGQMTF
jgi:hypothetical protein